MPKIIPVLLLLALAVAARRASASTAPAYYVPHADDPRDYFPPAPQDTEIVQPTPAIVKPPDNFDLWGAALDWMNSPPVVTPQDNPVIRTDFTRQPMNAQANLAAFLKVTRTVESDDNYGALVGGGNFTDFTDHPANKGWKGVGNSTAAGAYQITKTTWKSVLQRLPLPDFSPQSQDIAAVTILQFPWRQNAYADVLAGNFDLALSKLALEWEAFQKIIAGNYPYSLQDVRRMYADAGGGFSGTVAV